MNTNNNIEQRLWDYIDDIATADEKSTISQLIESNAEWRSKYQELLDVHQLMYSADLEAPSMRFTKNVMEEISRLQIAPATKSYINNNIIRGLSIFFITMIVGFLVYGFGQVDWTSSSDTKSPVKFDFAAIDYSKFFNSTMMNAFMMINVILGLFLLDRVLANKRKKFREEN